MGRFSVLVFRPKRVSYERSRGIDRWVLREISARIFVISKMSQNVPKSNKMQNMKIWIFRETDKEKLNCFSNPKPCWVKLSVSLSLWTSSGHAGQSSGR